MRFKANRFACTSPTLASDVGEGVGEKEERRIEGDLVVVLRTVDGCPLISSLVAAIANENASKLVPGCVYGVSEGDGLTDRRDECVLKLSSADEAACEVLLVARDSLVNDVMLDIDVGITNSIMKVVLGDRKFSIVLWGLTSDVRVSVVIDGITLDTTVSAGSGDCIPLVIMTVSVEELDGTMASLVNGIPAIAGVDSLSVIDLSMISVGIAVA